MIAFSIAMIIFFSIIGGIGLSCNNKDFGYIVLVILMCGLPIIQALLVIFGGM